MDLKTVVPSQFMAERGSNLVVVNPGSANVRMGFASQDVQFKIPHCIARRINPQQDQGPRFSVRDQMLNCHATSSMNAERERAYDIIAALLKIPFLDEEMPSANQPFPPKILGVLDAGKDAWIHREEWIKNGVHVGSGRKYKDSYFLQAQVMCYYNT